MLTSFFLTAFALAPLAVALPMRLPSPAGAVQGRQDGFPAGFPNPFNPSNAPFPRDPAAAACDTSKLQLPSSALAAPTGKLLMVALGQGTQNYTCSDTSSAPASVGALAQLSDATCALASDPSITTSGLNTKVSAAVGTHFFLDATTPDFDVSTLGNTVVKKAQAADAPNAASDVPWLRLTTQASGTTSQVKEIYRVNTVGGKAPASCAGQTPGQVFTVPYEAQYWFFG
ncbi:hypothetical protein yc1106_08393 [Curvularia clavata]|uniref:Malate dehydrogenase n=1 Tax=Curvularia clavata TaxID=95742 RepID=A0A9Q8ZEC0_CURCL|nr:hypothetical protein yc1106_08393 [Curvularia clavata]